QNISRAPATLPSIGGCRSPESYRGVLQGTGSRGGDTIWLRWGVFLGQYGKPFEPIATREVAFGMTVGDVERVEIQAELERILANPLFKNSRRYPNLLRYVVERTLDGHSADLKERTLGIEVFGRAPDYDTNLDPIVRTTAAEIRKRLAQYYQEA